jgi:hypothetical protein
MKSLRIRLTWLTLFSIAMGYMETAVVVYLRKIYYPTGFRFPLVPIEPALGLTEFLREMATIIMLLGIGILAGKKASQKFAFFIYSFAIWDIFYYVFLKMLLNWPESLFTWDILFLIPVPWVGPVLAPCIISLTMIVLTLFIIYYLEKGYNTRILAREWILLSVGSLVVIISFVWDYIQYIRSGHTTKGMWTLGSHDNLFDEIVNYVPTSYNWSLFWLGEVIILLGIFLYVKRIRALNPDPLFNQ